MRTSKTLPRILFFAFLLASFSFDAVAQERKVLPVDEANKDASFGAFREKTLQAAKKRDVKYILSILDPNIKNNFGGDGGIQEFKREWKIQSLQSKFWAEFITVLSNGGTFSRENGETKSDMFQAPYTFTQFPEDLDAFEYHSIFGSSVNLRSRPEAAAPVVATLSYNVVKVNFINSVKIGEDEYSWLKVETLGGKRGFVQSKYVRSPIAYRAIFEKKKGQWKMTAFIAGD